MLENNRMECKDKGFSQSIAIDDEQHEQHAHREEIEFMEPSATCKRQRKESGLSQVTRNDDADAVCLKGFQYLNGKDGVQKDEEKAAQLFQQRS